MHINSCLVIFMYTQSLTWCQRGIIIPGNRLCSNFQRVNAVLLRGIDQKFLYGQVR